jgi:hypothetical protein
VYTEVAARTPRGVEISLARRSGRRSRSRAGHRGTGDRSCSPPLLDIGADCGGLDGSEESQRALAFAIDEAVGRDASIEAVYGWRIPDVHDIEPFVNSTYVLEEEKVKADRLLAEAVSGWTDRYPDLTIRIASSTRLIRSMRSFKPRPMPT